MRNHPNKLTIGILSAILAFGGVLTAWWDLTDYGLRTEKQHVCILAQGDNSNGDDTNGDGTNGDNTNDPNYDPYDPTISNALLKGAEVRKVVISDGNGIFFAKVACKTNVESATYTVTSKKYNEGKPNIYYTIIFQGKMCFYEESSVCRKNSQYITDTGYVEGAHPNGDSTN